MSALPIPEPQALSQHWPLDLWSPALLISSFLLRLGLVIHAFLGNAFIYSVNQYFWSAVCQTLLCALGRGGREANSSAALPPGGPSAERKPGEQPSVLFQDSSVAGRLDLMSFCFRNVSIETVNLLLSTDFSILLFSGCCTVLHLMSFVT